MWAVKFLFSTSEAHATLRNKALYPIQTYCSPTEFCTGHLWSYSDLHNNDPEREEEGGDDEEER